MGAGFEITAEPTDFSPKGTFQPHADQAKFRSVFACVEGEKKPGWLGESEVRQGIPTQDGKGRLTFDEFKDGAKLHDIKFQGMRLREFYVPIDQANAKERYEGRLSEDRAMNHLRKTERPAGDMQIGRSSEGTSQYIETTIPAAL